MSKISIIIPTYNSESTIEETIASVQQQSFTDWELIIIDDGSQDNTVNVVQNIAEPRMQLFVYENGGVAIARNRGIAKAKGEFIALLDADDLWTPDKLELQLKALKDNTKAGVAYSWNKSIDEQGKILSLGSRPVCQGNVYRELLQTNFLSNGSNILARREAIESVNGFPTDFPTASDWDFYLKLASRWSFVVVPKYQILYRQSPNSMSSNIEAVIQDSCAVLEKAYQIASAELQSSRNKNFSNLYLYFADLYLKRSKDAQDLKQAEQNLWIAIRLYPQNSLNKNTQRTLVKFCRKKLLSIKITKEK